MEIITVNSLSEYVKTICEINNNLIRNGANLHEILLFRGHSNKSYELMPALGRNRTCSMDISILNEERNLIDLAKFKFPDIFRNDLQPVDLLALLQHYGIPTRLLDVTESALVALYFACCSSFEADGEIFAFKNNNQSVTNLPVINAIADSYRFSRGTFCPLSLFYGGVINQPYFVEWQQINEICHDTPEKGGEWIRKCCESLFFVYASANTLRQQVQRGRYILFSNHIAQYGDTNEYCFETIIDPIPKDHKSIAGRIIIPKELKPQMLSELSLMGISEGTLFADSIDIVCKSILEECKYRVTGDEKWQ